MENLKNLCVSNATLRTYDLTMAFLDFACTREELTAEYEQLIVDAFIPSYAGEDDTSDYWESEEAQYKLEELFDLLGTIAPDGYYFGTHAGNGSDFGFYELEEI